MSKIDLLELYPEFKAGIHKKETCFIEIPDSIKEEYVESLTPETAYVHILFEREEIAHYRKLFRYKAFYSLDSQETKAYKGEQLEYELVDSVPSAEDAFIEKLTLTELHDSLKKLPYKQFRRIYKHYFLGKSKTDIAVLENVSEFVVRRAIERGLKCLNLRLKFEK